MNTQTEKIKIAIGAMAGPIHQQLKQQGFKVTATDMIKYQNAIDGLIRLKFLDCMGDKEYDRIAQRIVGKIGKQVSKLINK